MRHKIDDKEKLLLDLLQSNFPVSSRPFMSFAKQLGMTEDEVIEKVQALRSRGLLRRIGGIFDAHKLGFSSTLLAAQVEQSKLEAVAQTICKYPGVTHCYERNHSYNLWFTLTSESKHEENKFVAKIYSLPGVQKLHNFPAIKKFKLNINFKLSENMDDENRRDR